MKAAAHEITFLGDLAGWLAVVQSPPHEPATPCWVIDGFRIKYKSVVWFVFEFRLWILLLRDQSGRHH